MCVTEGGILLGVTSQFLNRCRNVQDGGELSENSSMIHLDSFNHSLYPLAISKVRNDLSVVRATMNSKHQFSCRVHSEKLSHIKIITNFPAKEPLVQPGSEMMAFSTRQKCQEKKQEDNSNHPNIRKRLLDFAFHRDWYGQNCLLQMLRLVLNSFL